MKPEQRDVTALPRRYAMTRLNRGDYLLPSNDLTTLWRIYSYEEDGSLSYDDGTVVTGTFWAAARRPMPKAGEPIDMDEFLYSFEHWSGPHEKRQDAIDSALRAGHSYPPGTKFEHEDLP